MQTILPKLNGQRASARRKPILKLFIACEDKISYWRACRIQRQVERLCDDEMDVAPVYWNFALLRHQGLQEWAVMEAASAAIIILSLSGANELPEHVKSWAQRIPVRAEAGRAALVALIGANGKVRPAWEEDIQFLQGIADERGLDFFCNQNGGWGIGAAPPRDRSANQADSIRWAAMNRHN